MDHKAIAILAKWEVRGDVNGIARLKPFPEDPYEIREDSDQTKQLSSVDSAAV